MIVAPGWWVTNVGIMVFFGLVAYAPPVTRWWRRTVTDAVPIPALRVGFAAGVALHVIEARHAYRHARELGMSQSAGLWAAQAATVGFPSLLALRRLRAEHRPG